MEHQYSVKFMPPQCEAHALEVHVEYLGRTRDGIHNFSCSSLSQPGKEWTVEVWLSKRFNTYAKDSLTPEDLINSKLIRFYSNDPSFKWWSSQYLNTINSTSLYAAFIPPRVHEVAYWCCHPSLSVLQLLCELGPGVLTTKSNFSTDAKWSEADQKFTFSSLPDDCGSKNDSCGII